MGVDLVARLGFRAWARPDLACFFFPTIYIYTYDVLAIRQGFEITCLMLRLYIGSHATPLAGVFV